MNHVMIVILSVLLLLGFAGPLAAQPEPNPLALAQAGKWPEARSAAARTGATVATKLIDYLRMLTPSTAGAAEIAAFVRQSPDWPLPTLLERRRQEAIAAEHDDATVAALCGEKKPTPTPARGPVLLRCADALARLGRGNEAEVLAREAWVSAISDPVTEAAFVRRFPGLISASDQWARFQRLAWGDPAAAWRQIVYLDARQAASATMRMTLKTAGAGATGHPEDDPGAMLDLARWLRKLNQDPAAVALWRTSGTTAQRAAPEHLDAFWIERQLLARQLLHDGDPRGAYDVVAAHGQTDPALVTEAEFLAGFIALRTLNDPGAAAFHFNALAAASPAVLTQARASYWLGRTAVASGGDGHADFARAAAWPMTFYGQLAARAAGEPDATLVGTLRAAPASTSGLPDTPIVAELARAANQLVAWGDPRRARSFLSRMDEFCRTPAERIAVGDYATAMGLPDIMVMVARRLGREGIAPPMQGWPVPVEPPPVPEPTLSLAIMRQESNFDVGIVSAAGARGLMQLMPATARIVAHRLGEPTSEFLLTSDAGHNMRMGTAYLREVLEKFDNSVPLAAAAYNSGPHRVARWLLENGDPRNGNPVGGDPVAGDSVGGGNPRFGDRTMIDWIEMIPFNETRNYVQRVLENVVVYQARRTGTLPETMAQWSR